MTKTNKGTTRKELAEKTREKLKKKALELFREKGVDPTSVDAISRAAGVSKGAFYAHYKSKYSLIQEQLESLDLDYRRQFGSIPPERKASLALADFFDAIAVILETRLGLDLLRAVYRAEISREISLDPFVSKDRELYRVIRDILEKGKKDGSFRPDLDCEKISDHLVMAIRGMVFEWCSRAPDFNLRQELATHLGILTEGL